MALQDLVFGQPVMEYHHGRNLICNNLGFANTPIVFDMGLLTKALEITWAKPQQLEEVIPIEEGMHLLMSLFSDIGYLYGDAGLKQLFKEANIFAPNTVNNIMNGKDFDRACMV